MRWWHSYWIWYHRKRCKRADGYVEVNRHFERMQAHKKKLGTAL